MLQAKFSSLLSYFLNRSRLKRLQMIPGLSKLIHDMWALQFAGNHLQTFLDLDISSIICYPFFVFLLVLLRNIVSKT